MVSRFGLSLTVEDLSNHYVGTYFKQQLEQMSIAPQLQPVTIQV